MGNLEKTKIYNPKLIYYNIDFDSIKCHLKKQYTDYRDYGKSLILLVKDCTISINNIGKIEVYYNKQYSYDIIKNIEMLFKNQKSRFELLN